MNGIIYQIKEKGSVSDNCPNIQQQNFWEFHLNIKSLINLILKLLSIQSIADNVKSVKCRNIVCFIAAGIRVRVIRNLLKKKTSLLFSIEYNL